MHSNKNSEMDQQREQYESLNRQLERKLAELHGALAQQRQELLLEFKSEMQKREHGFRQQADSLSTVVSTHELKVGDSLWPMTAPSPDTRCGCWAQEGGLHTEASLAVLGSGVTPTVVPATWPFS